MNQCPATFLGNTCDLPNRHAGGHSNTTHHAYQNHEVVWTDETDELGRRHA